MMVLMLVFWVAVLVGIVLAIRWLVTRGGEPRAADPALEVLRERYAQGDVSRESSGV